MHLFLDGKMALCHNLTGAARINIREIGGIRERLWYA